MHRSGCPVHSESSHPALGWAQLLLLGCQAACQLGAMAVGPSRDQLLLLFVTAKRTEVVNRGGNCQLGTQEGSL